MVISVISQLRGLLVCCPAVYGRSNVQAKFIFYLFLFLFAHALGEGYIYVFFSSGVNFFCCHFSQCAI